ncbi:hypothetical protein [Aliagarivorans taiwanensis]|uniref:hypothetical protein n=1 Tax=Aliagarivorans taiwanensis TaxID=561966 RepID=UPI0004274801|nr:hypothetical protein [Aliagarivorans taiwanensis]
MLGKIRVMVERYLLMGRLALSGYLARNGLRKQARGQHLVISMTSIPSRVGLMGPTLECLLSQSMKPDAIVLWLSDELDSVPEVLQPYVERGLEVRFVPDVGPHTKLVYALQAFPDSVVVTADDDKLYPWRWLSKLYKSYQARPDCIHCHRAHLITKDENGIKRYVDWKWLAHGVPGPSFMLFPTGVGGVLYPPKLLHSDATNIPLFSELCPKADDIWFKAMALLNNVQSVQVGDKFRDFFSVDDIKHNTVKLGTENVFGGGNDKQIKAVFDHYDLKL